MKGFSALKRGDPPSTRFDSFSGYSTVYRRSQLAGMESSWIAFRARRSNTSFGLAIL